MWFLLAKGLLIKTTIAIMTSHKFDKASVEKAVFMRSPRASVFHSTYINVKILKWT